MKVRAGDFLFVALFGVLALVAPEHLLTDSSVGWHIRTGEAILASKTWVHEDLFSFGRQGAPWFAWEWLADLIMALLHRAAGLHGIVLGASALIAAVFRKLFVALLVRKNHYFASLAMVLLAFAASGIHALARPHLFTWYFCLTFYLLFDDHQAARTDRRRVFAAAPMMVLWANLHAGFVLGLLLAILFVAANLWNRDREKAKEFGLVTAALGAASLVSPYGYHLHAHVLEFLSSSHLMDTVAEYSSPDFHVFDGKCLYVLLAITVVSPALSKLRFATHEVLVLGFSIYAALFASRSVPTSVLLLCVIVTPHVSRCLEAEPRLASFQARAESRRLAALVPGWPVLPLAALALFGWMAAHEGRLFGRTVLRASFPAERYPLDGARAFLAAHPAVDHLLLPDYFAGYVIYYFYPRIRCVIDDRMDFYGEDSVRRYQDLFALRPGYRRTLDDWHVRYLLLPRRSALFSVLHDEWVTLFDDGRAVILERPQRLP